MDLTEPEQFKGARRVAGVPGLLLLLVLLGELNGFPVIAAVSSPPSAGLDPVTSFEKFHQLKVGGATSFPVQIQGVVLCWDLPWDQLYIHDGTQSGYLSVQQLQAPVALVPGQKVEMTGTAALGQGGWELRQLQFKVVRQGVLPPAMPLKWRQLADHAGEWVELRGRVRMVETSRGRLCLVFREQGQRCLVYVMGTSSQDLLKQWVGAEVRIRGLSAPAQDKGVVELQVSVPSTNEVQVLTGSKYRLGRLSPELIDNLLSRPLGPWTNEPVHVRGTIEALEPGKVLTVRDSSGFLRARISQDLPLPANTRAEVWGYLTVLAKEVILQDAYFEVAPASGPVPAPSNPLAGVVTNLPPLTQVSDILKLRKEEATQRRPVVLRGVMTYADAGWHNGFFQDPTGSIFVDFGQPGIEPGQGVEISGYTEAGGYKPQVRAESIRVQGSTGLPAAPKVDLEDLGGGTLDCHWIEMQGVVRRVTMIGDHARLDLTTAKGSFHALIPGIPSADALPLVDALVSLRGACGYQLNPRGQIIDFTMHVPGTNQVTLLEAAPKDPFATAGLPIKRVAAYDPNRTAGHRVKLRGTVILPLRGEGFFLQDDSAGIRVKTQQTNEVQRGDVVEAVGFPAVQDYSPCLEDAVFRKEGRVAVPPACKVTAEQILRSGTNDGSLVELEANVLQNMDQAAKPKLVLEDRSIGFSAQLEVPSRDQSLSHYELGSRLRLRGVCLVQHDESHQPETFRLLISQSSDIELMNRPPWFTPRYVLVGGGGLLVGILAAWAWIASLRVQVRKQTEVIRQEKNLLITLLDHLPDIVFVKDEQGCYLLTNRAHVQFHGASSHDYFIGKRSTDLVAPEIARVYAEADRRVLQEGQTLFDQEEPGRDKQGNERWLTTTKVPLRDKSGRIIGLVGISRDITSRKQAEMALRVSEERFRSVWEHSIDGMRLTDRLGRIIDVNEAYCRLVKLPRGKLLGQVFSITYKGHGPKDGIGEYIRRFDSGQLVPRWTARAQFWNAEEVDLEISSSFVHLGEQGKAILNIFRDVSERKRAELRSAAFSNLAHRLSEAKTAREAGEIIVDVADQLLGWDACFCNLYSPAEDVLVRVLAKDVIHGQRCDCPNKWERQAPSPLTRRAIESGGFLLLPDSRSSEPRSDVPFGDTTRLSASLLFVPIRKGMTVIGVLSIQSYTPNFYTPQSLHTLQALADHCGGALDRIRTEEALHTTQERLDNLLAQGPAMLYSLKTDGRSFQPTWVSHNVTRLLGYSTEAAYRPEWWLNHIHPADREHVAASAAQLLRDGRVAVEYRKRDQRGEYRWVRDEQQLVRNGDGQPAEIVGILMDITERKELEQQLRQSQKMEAIGQLAGGVAHDFNNLLAVIRGNSDLLLLAGQQGREVREDGLKQIIAAAERAANLTRQLLTFSRKQAMQLQSLNLNDVVDNLSKMLKRIIGEDIELQYRYAARLPFVKADVGMLEQVLVNLVVNARDAMPRGGRLLITTEKVSLGSAVAQLQPDAREGEFVCLSVNDTGTGIAPEHLPRIFEPFFTTKEVGKGTGLGLATVYGIVKQHQGWVSVSSQLGTGSTFQVFLPAADPPAATAAKEVASEKPPGGTETVLLVEDDDPVRSLTRRLLESYGYRVLEATSGPAALKVWAEHQAQIEVLLTDIIMPEGLTGLELAEQLRAVRPGLKVVFVSGYGGEQDPRSALFRRQPHSVFLQKPCSSRDLLRAMRRILDPEAKASSGVVPGSGAPFPEPSR